MSGLPKADGDVSGIHPVLGTPFLDMVKMLGSELVLEVQSSGVQALTSISARRVA